MPTVVEGDIFIVPNGAVSINGKNKILVPSSAQRILNDAAQCGIAVDGLEPLVQVWATSEESDNWADHGHPAGPEFYRGASSGFRGIPTFLPARVLEGKEGEVLELPFDPDGSQSEPRYLLRLTRRQLPYRYRRFGTFENTLTARVKGW